MNSLNKTWKANWNFIFFCSPRTEDLWTVVTCDEKCILYNHKQSANEILRTHQTKSSSEENNGNRLAVYTSYTSLKVIKLLIQRNTAVTW